MRHLLHPAWLALIVVVASTLFVHRRGKERLRLGRQLTDFSTFMAPFNIVAYLFSAVPNRPMLDAGEFPELGWLQGSWETIRDEARALLADSHVRGADRYDDMIGNAFFRHGWRRFYVKWYGAPLPSAQKYCPKTVAILQQIPKLHAAMFSLIPPGGRLGRHRDAFAGSLRYHLGLITPNSDLCRIYIDGQMYSWRDGQGVLFDETYIHWVENETDESRLVLFCDFERPLRSRLATAANHLMIRYVGPLTATGNEDGAPVGLANRLVAAVHPLHLATRRFKARSHTAYYALKYAVIAAALVVLLFVV